MYCIKIERALGMPDCLLLDPCALILPLALVCRWYATEVFLAMTKHTFVSLHDVHNPKFWGDSFDDKAFREVRPSVSTHALDCAQLIVLNVCFM